MRQLHALILNLDHLNCKRKFILVDLCLLRSGTNHLRTHTQQNLLTVGFDMVGFCIQQAEIGQKDIAASFPFSSKEPERPADFLYIVNHNRMTE